MPDIPVVLLGSGAVGKSCIAIQYIQGHFVDRYDATIEDVYRKPVEVDNTPAVLTIVDTAGQDAFGAVRDQYLKRGQGFLLIYSIADSESFQNLKRIYAQLLRTKGDHSQMSCIVVGNKLDLAAQRAVSYDEGKMFASHAKCPFMEISAKNRGQVEEAFAVLVRSIRDKQSATSSSGGAGGAGATSASTSANAAGSGGAASGGASGGNNSNAANAGNKQSSQPAGSSAKPQPKPQKKKRCTML
ncbi:ras-related GTP-binding protein, putative [Bodo saltans]|uniref:Ras-related GTP-binding protein, putative n=1 Tax=Bodo saltans TaxID=75058 RepID=A0A0S4J2B4_BODSA|nr:ras-related GTP-binding protein, putative [Bodo saltans]|eukprot:CUG54184.1 ras-related GTP-binding protein, putative [Bodo saltans]